MFDRLFRRPDHGLARQASARHVPPRLEELEARVLLTAFYVNRRGNDSNPGTSPQLAWKTLDRVNQQKLQPGDSVSFAGGQLFTSKDGQHGLFCNQFDAGTAANPITFTSYGKGRATIFSGNDTGLLVYSVGGYNVNNLIFAGSGMYTNVQSGIRFTDQLTNGVTLEHVYIDNVDVSGYGSAGIGIDAIFGTSYYHDVRVTNSTLHDNLSGGLITTGPGGAGMGNFTRTISDVYVGHVEAYNNPGQNPDNVGFGIGLTGVDGGVVERSLAHDNGALGNSGAGFFTYNSSNVTLQFNESYRDHSAGVDGDGLVLDWDTVNCTMQYNYSHENDGAGFALLGSPGSGLPGSSGDVVRFNVSENDARAYDAGAITVYSGPVDNAEIYNNTVYLAGRGGTGYAAAQVFAWYGSGLHLRNNIFMTTQGVPLVQTSASIDGTDLLFQGNDYFASGAAFVILYGGQTYNGLNSWRNATGQEKLNGSPVGFSTDPQLNNPGGGGTVGNADLLATLTAYQLKPTSPLKNSGLNLPALFGIDPGPQDFYGDPIPNGSGFSVGADDPA
jgi:hypothetical protein